MKSSSGNSPATPQSKPSSGSSLDRMRIGSSGDITFRYLRVDVLVHGHGVFATRVIPAGLVIGRYTGRRYGPSQVQEHDWDHDVTHVFGLSDGSVIDGADGGNATRYINHSCAPNCVAYEIEDAAGELQDEIEALRRIARGAELFLDYGLDVGEADPLEYPCRCGVRRCRGTLASA